MKIVISSDEYFPLIDVLLEEVQKRGHEVHYVGPRQGEKSIDWPDVTLKAMEEIKEGKADEGIVLCWTGTGCSIVANNANLKDLKSMRTHGLAKPEVVDSTELSS